MTLASCEEEEEEGAWRAELQESRGRIEDLYELYYTRTRRAQANIDALPRCVVRSRADGDRAGTLPAADFCNIIATDAK